MKKKLNRPMFKLDSYNFIYNIDYDCNTTYDHEKEGCNESGICRCGVIHPEIKSVNIDGISDVICKEFGIKDVATKYCVNRICSSAKMWDKDDWHINKCGGYYGEEVDSINFTGDSARIMKAISDVNSAKTIGDKIRIALSFEYGYVLPQIQILEAKIISVSPIQVFIGQTDHYKKLQRDIIKFYKEDWNKEFPVCIVHDYKLIDGYHRYAAHKDDKSIRVVFFGETI